MEIKVSPSGLEVCIHMALKCLGDACQTNDVRCKDSNICRAIGIVEAIRDAIFVEED